MNMLYMSLKTTNSNLVEKLDDHHSHGDHECLGVVSENNGEAKCVFNKRAEKVLMLSSTVRWSPNIGNPSISFRDISV